jgi:hypothetical protein
VTPAAVQLAATKKEADEETREEELDRRRKTAAPVPAAEAMTREELASARPREPKEVLEVWRRSSERAGHRGIERPAHRGEKQDCGDARADLETAVGDVAMRHSIADEVEEQSEWQRAEPRTDERAARSTGRNVKGYDQAASLAPRVVLRVVALAARQGVASVVDSIAADAQRLSASQTRSARRGLARAPAPARGRDLGWLGWSLVDATLGLIPTALLAVLFDLKARRGEVWLIERPQYAAYRARTPRRFVLCLY